MKKKRVWVAVGALGLLSAAAAWWWSPASRAPAPEVSAPMPIAKVSVSRVLPPATAPVLATEEEPVDVIEPALQDVRCEGSFEQVNMHLELIYRGRESVSVDIDVRLEDGAYVYNMGSIKDRIEAAVAAVHPGWTHLGILALEGAQLYVTADGSAPMPVELMGCLRPDEFVPPTEVYGTVSNARGTAWVELCTRRVDVASDGTYFFSIEPGGYCTVSAHRMDGLLDVLGSKAEVHLSPGTHEIDLVLPEKRQLASPVKVIRFDNGRGMIVPKHVEVRPAGILPKWFRAVEVVEVNGMAIKDLDQRTLDEMAQGDGGTVEYRLRLEVVGMWPTRIPDDMVGRYLTLEVPMVPIEPTPEGELDQGRSVEDWDAIRAMVAEQEAAAE